jgi:transposase
MARTEQFNENTKARQMRYFSESFKKAKIIELDRNQTTIAELSREYQVTRSSIYKWIYKYSIMKKKGIKQVIETESETRQIIALKEKIKELEQIIGQKQIQLEFKDKMIEIAEETYKIDLKKKFGSSPSTGSGSTGKNTNGN